jgi:UDP-3-O-[3-hydroxymyristoyl] glucosamine N-acyltransferase
MEMQNRVPINEVIENIKRLNIQIYESKLNIDFIDRVSSISDTSSNSLAYIAKKKYIPNSSEDVQGLIVIEAEIFDPSNFHDSRCSYLVVEHAKYGFASLYELLSITNVHSFNTKKENQNSYSQSIVFGPDVYIGKNVTIGENTLIYPGVRILDDSVIGSNVVIKSNGVLGGSGFGYAIRSGFPPLRIPHLGNVIIGNGVEIGSNTAIDRATFGSTVVEDFVKIDNGVHIAHNCRVGKRTLVIAHAELSGSVIVGHDSWIAPNVSIKESVKIGNNVIVGIGSVVLKDLPDNAVAFGVPAKIIRYQNQLAT